ncbi:MAG: zinc-binding dehydrogenase, partial [Microcystis panniformis]
LTDGAGVDVVYDSVGAATFEKSLKILKSRGLLVAFGQSSGFIPPFDVNLLANSSSDRGSFFLTRPTTAHYLKGQEFTERLLDIFEYIAQKKLSVLIGQKYSLNHSLEAHIALANRQTIGKSIIVL